VLPISFISDFGTEDEFVGVVHGVIARIAPEVRVIDVTHGIAAGNIRAGALALTRAIQYLPQGVVLAVVDPGVGTERRPIVVETGWGLFVGPDNGLLSPAVAMVGGASGAHVISNPDLVIPSAGSTFDGRDRFGPAAAALASGQVTIADVGPSVDPAALTPTMLPLPSADGTSVSGTTWWVDHFGNAQTNIGPDDIAGLGISVGDTVTVRLGPTHHELRYVRAYGEVEAGEGMLIVDSQGLIAISVRESRADQRYHLDEGRSVIVQADSS